MKETFFEMLNRETAESLKNEREKFESYLENSVLGSLKDKCLKVAKEGSSRTSFNVEILPEFAGLSNETIKDIVINTVSNNLGFPKSNIICTGAYRPSLKLSFCICW